MNDDSIGELDFIHDNSIDELYSILHDDLSGEQLDTMDIYDCNSNEGVDTKLNWTLKKYRVDNDDKNNQLLYDNNYYDIRPVY